MNQVPPAKSPGRQKASSTHHLTTRAKMRREQPRKATRYSEISTPPTLLSMNNSIAVHTWSSSITGTKSLNSPQLSQARARAIQAKRQVRLKSPYIHLPTTLTMTKKNRIKRSLHIQHPSTPCSCNHSLSLSLACLLASLALGSFFFDSVRNFFGLTREQPSWMTYVIIHLTKMLIHLCLFV